MNDKERILQEIAKKKERAYQLGLPEIVFDLYDNHIKFYPSWINNKGKSRVCTIITSAKRISDEEQINDVSIQIEFEGKSFIFRLIEGSHSKRSLYYVLELYYFDKKVFILSIEDELHPGYDNWQIKIRDVLGFIEGEWIEDILKLKKQIENEKKKREEESKNKDLGNLKRDFGIE